MFLPMFSLMQNFSAYSMALSPLLNGSFLMMLSPSSISKTWSYSPAGNTEQPGYYFVAWAMPPAPPPPPALGSTTSPTYSHFFSSVFHMKADGTPFFLKTWMSPSPFPTILAYSLTSGAFLNCSISFAVVFVFNSSSNSAKSAPFSTLDGSLVKVLIL